MGSCPVFGQFNTNLAVTTGSDYISAITDFSLRFDTLCCFPSKIVLRDLNKEAEAWKKWNTVENFTFGKDRGSLPMIADLNALHPYFRDKIRQMIQLCKKKGIELAIVESYRTHSKQAEYFGMGRQYTRSAGGKSKHQYGLAIDVVPLVNGIPQWENKTLWKRVGVIGESLGLRWGGRWRSPYDPAHFEWTGGATTALLSMGIYPSIPNADQYPCIHDDLSLLKTYWEAWETEQSSMARNSHHVH